jgi:hypothetical protein
MTDVVPWVILDELGKPVAKIQAATQSGAIKAFCYPALREEAYFGTGGWTCRLASDAR